MLGIAFKEWAVVCRAVAEGTQTILLRKGGIAEVGGEYRPEHERFWLYPTYFHERQQDGVREESIELLDKVEGERPPEGILRIDTLVEVVRVDYVTDLNLLLKFEDFHIGTEEMIRGRFHYRKPGVYLHLIRAHRLAEAALIPEHPAYSGCKTWVELETPILSESASPVVTDGDFRARQERYANLLQDKASAVR